jgi:hypothetical protein
MVNSPLRYTTREGGLKHRLLGTYNGLLNTSLARKPPCWSINQYSNNEQFPSFNLQSEIANLQSSRPSLTSLLPPQVHHLPRTLGEMRRPYIAIKYLPLDKVVIYKQH